MPNSCSVPGCKSHYNVVDRVSVFKMPEILPDLKYSAWTRALHHEDIIKLKVVDVCINNFQKGDIVHFTFKVPK